MNSGHMKAMSPTIPPWTWASATPKAATIAHMPIKGPIPPPPDVAKSTSHNYQKQSVMYKTDNKEIKQW